MVAIPLNTSSATKNPVRLLYPQTEIDRNENIPTPQPSIFDLNPVNK